MSAAIFTFSEHFHDSISVQDAVAISKPYTRTVSVTKITSFTPFFYFVAKRLIFSCFMEGSASAPRGEGTIDAPRDLPIPAL